MKTKKYWLILVLLVIPAFVGGILATGLFLSPSVQAQKAAETRRTDIHKWEYLVVNSGSHKELAEKVNTLGEQGWELVTTLPVDSFGAYVAYLKRSKP